MIVRRARNGSFTIVANHIAEDERLSYEAVGLMTYLLSRPDNWQVHVSQLRARGGCGRDKTRKLIAELIKAGYVTREQARSEDGRQIRGVVYTIYDEPQSADQAPENPSLEALETDSQAPGNQAPENPSPYTRRKDNKTDSQQIEREARASEREEGQPEVQEPLDRRNREALERRFWKMVRNHPQSAGMPKDGWLREWLKLSPEDQDLAEQRHLAWLALLKRQSKDHIPALSKYFSQKLFNEVPQPEPEKPPALEAKAFGKLWQAARLKQLIAGPTLRSELTAFQRRLVEAGQADEAAVRLESQAKTGFPAVNRMHEQASYGRGMVVAPELEPLAELMERVRVGSELWEAWRAEHEARGWPWLPDPGKQEWVYFPAAGPAGLEAFEQAVRETSERKEAAE